MKTLMKPAQNQLPASNYPKRVFVHQEICLVTDYPCPCIIKKQNVVFHATGDNYVNSQTYHVQICVEKIKHK